MNFLLQEKCKKVNNLLDFLIKLEESTIRICS